MKRSLSRSPLSRKELVAAIVGQARGWSMRAITLHAVVAERLGLNPSDHKCAELLMSESGISTPGRLAELTGLSTGAITGVLDRLERAGFVVREADPDDRRRTWVRLTPERMPNMRRIYAPFSEGMEKLCSHYSVAELQLIHRFLRESETMAELASDEVRKRTDAT